MKALSLVSGSLYLETHLQNHILFADAPKERTAGMYMRKMHIRKVYNRDKTLSNGNQCLILYFCGVIPEKKNLTYVTVYLTVNIS